MQFTRDGHLRVSLWTLTSFAVSAAAVALFSHGLSLPVLAASGAASGHEGPRMSVQHLTVSSTVLRSGAIGTVEALVGNTGTVPVHDLRIGVTGANEEPLRKGRSGRTWAPLEHSPASPVGVFPPGETVSFLGRARLEGDGWFSVGVGGRGAEAVLLPVVRQVRVVEPETTAVDAAAIVGTHAVLLATGYVLVTRLIRTPKGTVYLAPHRGVVATGVACLAASGVVFWLTRPSYVQQLIHALGPDAARLPLVGLMLFVVGWIVSFAGVRPRGSGVRGSALGAALYLLVGLALLVGYPVTQGVHVFQLLPFFSRDPALVPIYTLLWPYQLAAVWGWLDVANR